MFPASVRWVITVVYILTAIIVVGACITAWVYFFKFNAQAAGGVIAAIAFAFLILSQTSSRGKNHV